jgi:hypothetical protein
MADSYSYDMQRLQQDAIRRAREMQSRAQNFVAPQQIPTGARPVQTQNANPIPASSRPPEQPSNTQPREQPAPVHEQRVPTQAQPDPVQVPQETQHEQSKSPLGSVTDIFESLMKDSEKTLIFLLILLLVEEKSDPGVIFALVYLIL